MRIRTTHSLRSLLLSMLTYYIWNEKEDVLTRHEVHVIEGIEARVIIDTMVLSRVWANGRFSRLDISTCSEYILFVLEGKPRLYRGKKHWVIDKQEHFTHALSRQLTCDCDPDLKFRSVHLITATPQTTALEPETYNGRPSVCVLVNSILKR